MIVDRNWVAIDLRRAGMFLCCLFNISTDGAIAKPVEKLPNATGLYHGSIALQGGDFVDIAWRVDHSSGQWTVSGFYIPKDGSVRTWDLKFSLDGRSQQASN